MLWWHTSCGFLCLLCWHCQFLGSLTSIANCCALQSCILQCVCHVGLCLVQQLIGVQVWLGKQTTEWSNLSV